LGSSRGVAFQNGTENEKPALIGRGMRFFPSVDSLIFSKLCQANNDDLANIFGEVGRVRGKGVMLGKAWPPRRPSLAPTFRTEWNGDLFSARMKDPLATSDSVGIAGVGCFLVRAGAKEMLFQTCLTSHKSEHRLNVKRGECGILCASRFERGWPCEFCFRAHRE
jgi:hypothetical protein